MDLTQLANLGEFIGGVAEAGGVGSVDERMTALHPRYCSSFASRSACPVAPISV